MSTREVTPPSVKVLLVDDDEIFRHTTARLLAAHGYACVEAASSAQGRVLLDAEQDVAAVLCDIKMPGRSGIALLTELTADFSDVAVVMTTGVDDPSVADVAFAAGAFGYVIKPFDANELLISLAGALKRRELELAQQRQMREMERAIARTRMVGNMLQGIESGEATAADGDEETMERLSRAVSLRDEETGRHIERMSRYAVVLAEKVGFTGVVPDDLRLATALHDVGKIGVPDGILLKPGPLSGDETKAMQRHAQIGYQLLVGSSSELLGRAADIAFSHHEWWNGGGYPRGLVGDEISEEARIAAVVDVFDALTSDRVYRPAMSFEDAIAVMEKGRDVQFEPRLLDAFIDSMDEISAIRATFPDEKELEPRIRILIVDDHAIFTQSLARLLGSRSELKVVGTAGTTSEAVAATLAYQPDVILMDFELPDGDGADATAQIKALCPTVKVLMLTARTDDHALLRAISAGCSGFLKKEDAVDGLYDAIVAAHEGESVTPPGELAPLMRRLRPTHRGLGRDLTPREVEVLELSASGLVNKQIAEHLGLRLNTVRNHTQKVLSKLDAHSKLEAVATAVREGIIRYP